MKTRLLFLTLLAAAVLLAAGCETVDTRIKEKPEVFAGLDAATQAKLKQGIIDLGFTEDMVYIALGAPDQKRESISAHGRTITWIYNTYYDYYDGSAYIHYHRRVYYDPVLSTYRVFYRPALADVYVSAAEERIRVVFKEGKVSVIEQAKD